MTTISPAHLFVYGTLRGDDTGRLGRAQRERLKRESRSLGAARMPGRLVDIGTYPGLVEAGSGDGVVHGEVVVLENAERSLKWLDAYECFVPGDDEHNEYAREARIATLAGGQRIEAWVYLYLKPGDAPTLPGGDWVKRSGA